MTEIYLQVICAQYHGGWLTVPCGSSVIIGAVRLGALRITTPLGGDTTLRIIGDLETMHDSYLHTYICSYMRALPQRLAFCGRGGGRPHHREVVAGAWILADVENHGE